ncbi:MAG: hypothetical protein OXG51_13565, partial [Gammaproteobacteria bacterium]|nr:hypothetical protein [Gammaproteobacteria bacterium]
WGVGLSIALAEAAPVLGLDVGDAVLGAPYGGLVSGLRLRGGNRGPRQRDVASATGASQQQAEGENRQPP